MWTAAARMGGSQRHHHTTYGERDLEGLVPLAVGVFSVLVNSKAKLETSVSKMSPRRGWNREDSGGRQ